MTSACIRLHVRLSNIDPNSVFLLSGSSLNTSIPGLVCLSTSTLPPCHLEDFVSDILARLSTKTQLRCFRYNSLHKFQNLKTWSGIWHGMSKPRVTIIKKLSDNAQKLQGKILRSPKGISPRIDTIQDVYRDIIGHGAFVCTVRYAELLIGPSP